MVSSWSVLLSLAALLLPLLAPLSVSAQSYIPYATQSTSCSVATATAVTFGDATYDSSPDSYSSTTVYSGDVYFTAFNNTLFGAQLTQLALPLGNNNGPYTISGPVHLRLGLYTVGAYSAASGSSLMALVGQTDEITLFPSGPQVLYANLLSPVQLISGGQYALAVATDGSFNAYQSMTATEGYSAYPNGGYSDYSMPNTLSAYGPSSYGTLAFAATGCLDPNSIAAPGTALYYMCGYTEQYAPSVSASDYNQVSTTTMNTVSGVLTVSTAATSTAFGSGYNVLSFSGTLNTQLSGENSYYSPYFTTSIVSLTRTNTTNKFQGVTPSNLVYTSGAAGSVDTNGLSFTGSAGVQYLMQWNAATSQYQLLTTANNGAAPSSPIIASGVTLSPITATSDPRFICTQSQKYTAPAAATCPAGTSSVYVGDFQATKKPSDYVPQLGSATNYGNVIYFRPFTVQVANTQVNSLATFLLDNPGLIVHMRLGLYASNGTTAAPSWTLLAMAPEQIIANPAAGAVEVPLATAVTLQAGTYAIGVWFDQPTTGYTLYWNSNPYPFNLYLQYTALSASGQMPAVATPQQDYQIAVAGAQTCVPTTVQTTQFSFCSAVATDGYGGIDVMSGVLTVLATTQTNSFGQYYVVVGGNATRGSGNPTYGLSYYYNAVPGAISNAFQQRLYVPSTTKTGVALDTTGLQFLHYPYSLQLYIVATTLIPNTPVYQYVPMTQGSYGNPYPVGVTGGEFSYQPYTAGSPIPDCSYVPINYANLLTPPSATPLMCVGASALNVTHGDSVLADYANQVEGRSLPAMTVYTNTFTVAISGLSVNQITVDVLANTAQNLTVYMGVYSSTGALLASTDVLLWQQVFDQQIVANLTTPVSLAPGNYFTAIVTDGPLNIATSTTTSPSLAVSSITTGLPATMSISGTRSGSVPIFVTGCAPATHSMCSLVQHYVPANGYGPVSVTYQYQGLIAAAVNADGSATVYAANIHASALQRTYNSYTSYTQAYTMLSATTPSKVYPAAATGLDATGLLLYSSALGVYVNLSYSAAAKQYVDSWGSSAYPGSPIVSSSFSLTPLATAGVLVPACSILNQPASISSSPAAPTCAAGTSAAMVGDYVNANYGFSAEGSTTYQNDWFFITRPITTGASSITLTQLALGTLGNSNSVARFRLAVYDINQRLLGSTNEVTVTNSMDTTIVGVLTAPVTLTANTTYYLASWSDTYLYLAYNNVPNQLCGDVRYSSGLAFPATFGAANPSLGTYCTIIPLAGLGCTVASGAPVTVSSSTGSLAFVTSIVTTPPSPPTPTSATTTPTARSSSSSSSSSTASSSPITTSSNDSGSNDVSLSAGAVAGIVIGCVFGTNLLLLACLFLLCGLGRGKSSNGSVQKSRQATSEADPHSRVELASAEPSKFDKESD